MGLGTRLQIMQNKLVQQITSHGDFDLTLPGKQKCAYFCITSDQDSTYDVLATLFTSFLSIKLVNWQIEWKIGNFRFPCALSR